MTQSTERRLARLHCPVSLQADTMLTPEAGQAHYLLHVLRLQPGDRLHLFNAKDGEWLAELTEVEGSSVRLHILERVARHTESPLRVVLGQVIARGKRTDLTIQKCTELGVAEIWPLLSERCQVRADQRALAAKQRRWQEIANESARQCLRTMPPPVKTPQPLTKYLEQHSCGVGLVGVVMHESATQSAKNLSDLIKPIAKKNDGVFSLVLLVGPEGGFSPAEIELITQQHGFHAWLLGPRLLRTETAAPAALAILQYLYGDLKE